MQRRSPIALCLAAAFGCSASNPTGPVQDATALTGYYSGSRFDPGGEVPMTIRLTQSGDSVTATLGIAGEEGGANFRGTVQGASISGTVTYFGSPGVGPAVIHVDGLLSNHLSGHYATPPTGQDKAFSVSKQ